MTRFAPTGATPGSALTPSSTQKVEEFLHPSLVPARMDLFTIRSAILRELTAVLSQLHGVLLDVGCGYMPYKGLLTSPPTRVTHYIGMDLRDNLYQRPDVEWDGTEIPMGVNRIDCAVATETFEHCPEPALVMREILRVLKPGGLLFFTVPFIWDLHCVPHDEYRYTPFALSRHLHNAGFVDVRIKATGGWDSSLAQMLGLWVRRRPMVTWKRALLSRLIAPLIGYLFAKQYQATDFSECTMPPGLCGTATKPVAPPTTCEACDD
jgi:SAM-dependent methyltransferase